MTAIPNSFRSIVVAKTLGTDYSRLSDEEIEAIRLQTDAWGHVLLGIYLDQQRQERAREVATDERGSIPVWSENGPRWKQMS